MAGEVVFYNEDQHEHESELDGRSAMQTCKPRIQAPL